jgi:hypothetical protein
VYNAYSNGVKVDSDNNGYLYLGTDVVDLTAYGTFNNYDSTATSASDGTNLSQTLANYLNGETGNVFTTSSEAKTLAQLGLTKVIATIEDAVGTHVVYLENNNAASTIAANADWEIKFSDLVSGTSSGKAAYVGEDGYSFTVDPALKSLKKFSGIKASDDDGTTYAYTISAIVEADGDFDDLRLAVAEALSADALSTSARAVRIKLYQYGVSNGTPFLTEVVYPNKTVSIAAQNDLLSRTGLKAATVDAYFVSTTIATDEDGVQYRKLGSLASSLDTSAAYKTFNLPLAYTVDNGYVVIFDKSADESQNDGVASETTTTTAASETAASSPKTGDVAPIAALAVVMMGACGAMVVASKKRA